MALHLTFISYMLYSSQVKIKKKGVQMKTDVKLNEKNFLNSKKFKITSMKSAKASPDSIKKIVDITLPLVPEVLENMAQDFANGDKSQIEIYIEHMKDKNFKIDTKSKEYNELKGEVYSFFKSGYTFIIDRGYYLKQKMNNKMATEFMFDKHDLCEILIKRLKDPNTSSQHIAPMATTLGKFMDWDSPIKVEHSVNEVQKLINDVSDSRIIPNDSIIDGEIVETYQLGK